MIQFFINGSYPQLTFTIFINRSNSVTVRVIETKFVNLSLIAIIPYQASLRPYPHVTLVILQECIYIIFRQTIFYCQVIKTKLVWLGALPNTNKNVLQY